MTKRNSALNALTRRNMLMGFGVLGAASMLAACGVPSTRSGRPTGTSRR